MASVARVGLTLNCLGDGSLTISLSTQLVLLLFDGHSSHFQPELLRYAKDHEVILLCLPPHTTHESHPLDASVFGQ